MKTGFNHCCVNVPDALGIVTADADGQHLAEDIRKVAMEFLHFPRGLVIGARSFTRGIPLRSLIGNMTTRYVFKLFVGGNLSDTQSGLRGIPMDILPGFIQLEGSATSTK
ncbi:MAG: hypothetical protein MZW92_43590 [Comamonadaceae bacterium]|nr:hypothetical protein [Comamonadaceae bacterium]